MGPLVASFIPMLESVAAEWRRGQTLSWEESCHHLMKAKMVPAAA